MHISLVSTKIVMRMAEVFNKRKKLVGIVISLSLVGMLLFVNYLLVFCEFRTSYALNIHEIHVPDRLHG